MTHHHHDDNRCCFEMKGIRKVPWADRGSAVRESISGGDMHSMEGCGEEVRGEDKGVLGSDT